MSLDAVMDCAECGKALHSAWFCQSCRLAFCSPQCLTKHKAGKHGPAPASAKPPPGRDTGRA
jgi:hypothetical protein